LNPLNNENGYMDARPPYNRMYYRVLISFDGGTYEIGKSSRPVLESDDLVEFNVTALPKLDTTNIITEIPSVDSEKSKIETIHKDTISSIKKQDFKIIDTQKSENKIIVTKIDSVEIYSLQKNSFLIQTIHASINYSTKVYSLKKIKAINIKLENKIVKTQWDYPSDRVYINNQNIITIQLKKTATRKYNIKIFDEFDHLVLTIKKINEDFFYIDKSNFRKSGWYHFEILNDGELVEKNKFQVIKDKSPK
jgi:predicted nuclease of predicted toxin-antitoxin system